MAVAPGARPRRAAEAAGRRALRRRAVRPAGVRPPGRHLDLLGLEGRLFRFRGGRPRLLRRDALHARAPDGRAELAAMVQHRPALGLWHRRPGAGPLLRRFPDRPADRLRLGLRASAAACLLHPGRRRRPGERGRHHGPLGARGAPVQIRLRHRLQLLPPARRQREAVRRRQVLRPHELPQDRRSRRRRHQVGRHHPPRRQDGDGRPRPPGHRGIHRLEGGRGAEGRLPGRRLAGLQRPPQPRHQGRPLRRRRRQVRPAEEPGA